MSVADELIAAVRTNDAARVRQLLDRDPSLARTPTRDGSLILTAVYAKAEDSLAALLAHQVALNIHEAAAVGDAARINQLLAYDPSLVRAETPEGYTPLGLASFFGRAEAAAALLAHGADVNALMDSKVPYVPKNTALHSAIAGGPHRPVVELLLDHGARVDIFDSNGHTPLHNAAYVGDLAVVEMLLARGADPTARRNGGRLPIELAEARGHGAVVERLRASGPR